MQHYNYYAYSVEYDINHMFYYITKYHILFMSCMYITLTYIVIAKFVFTKFESRNIVKGIIKLYPVCDQNNVFFICTYNLCLFYILIFKSRLNRYIYIYDFFIYAF